MEIYFLHVWSRILNLLFDSRPSPNGSWEWSWILSLSLFPTVSSSWAVLLILLLKFTSLFFWHNSGPCFYNSSSRNLSLITLFSRLWSSICTKAKAIFYKIKLFAYLSTTFSMPSHFTQDYSHSLWEGSRGVTHIASYPSSQSFCRCLIQSSCYTGLPITWTNQGLSKCQDFVHVAASLLFSWCGFFSFLTPPWLMAGPFLLFLHIPSSFFSPLSKSFLVDCLFHHTLNSVKEGAILLC